MQVVNRATIADTIGISPTHLTNIFKIKRIPSWSLAKKLGRIFFMPPEWFMDPQPSTYIILGDRIRFLAKISRKLSIPAETITPLLMDNAVLPAELQIKLLDHVGGSPELWRKPLQDAIQQAEETGIINRFLEAAQ